MNYFSIGYQIEKENNRSQYSNKYFRGNMQSEVPIKNNLSQSVIETLIKFGFQLDKIMFAYKIYKFQNIDDAIYIMMKDNETGKYNHKFIKNDSDTNINNNVGYKNGEGNNGNNENRDNLNNNNINNNLYLNMNDSCYICGGLSNEHVDYEFKEIKLVIDPKLNDLEKNKYKNKNNNVNLSEINQSNSNCKINIENNYIISKNLISNVDNSNIKLENINDIGKLTNNKIADSNKNNDISNSNSNNNDNSNVEENKNKPNITNNFLGDNLSNKNKCSENFNSNIKTNYISADGNMKIPIMRSDIQINIDKDTLDAFEDPEICTICFENKINKNNSSEFSCGHKFCNTCVKSHLTTNIVNGRVKKFLS